MDSYASLAMWFARNTGTVEAIAAVAGVGVSFGGFVLVICQLWQTQKALKAGNTYEIQRDARSMMPSVWDEDLQRFMREYTKPEQFETEQGKQAGRKIAKFIQFYLSVYRQYRARGITKALANSMARDFRSFFSHQAVKDYFERQRGDGAYTEEHAEMVNAWTGEKRGIFGRIGDWSTKPRNSG